MKRHRNETLQELFVRSRGDAVAVGHFLVSQVGRIPIRRGTLQIHLVSPPDPNQGLRFDSNGGSIALPDGSSVERVQIWHEPELPDFVTYEIWTPADQLLIWNVYRVHHPNGETTEDYWTGNAGMVLLNESKGYRRYGCSDWRSPFTPSALVFDVRWAGEGNEKKTGPSII
jgi:hypothetical protein